VRLFVNAVLLCEASGEVGRDQLAKLGEDGQVDLGGLLMGYSGDPDWDCTPATSKNHAL
jgi:hypothetical protein